MPTFKYVGPHDEVDVPALGLAVKRGEPVEVTDPDVYGKRPSGDDLGSGLYAQPDNWEHVPAKKGSKKAAASEVSEASQQPVPAPDGPVLETTEG